MNEQEGAAYRQSRQEVETPENILTTSGKVEGMGLDTVKSS